MCLTLTVAVTGYTASYMETLIMTESGIEVLSRLPRT